MTNKEKYNNIFVEVFGVSIENLGTDFSKDNIDEWDSVHQLNIMAMMEDAFDIMLDPEDVIALTSYDNGIAVLKKFEIEL